MTTATATTVTDEAVAAAVVAAMDFTEGAVDRGTITRTEATFVLKAATARFAATHRPDSPVAAECAGLEVALDTVAHKLACITRNAHEAAEKAATRHDRPAVARQADVDAREACVRCGGSGQYQHHGDCFRCGGSGRDPKFT